MIESISCAAYGSGWDVNNLFKNERVYCTSKATDCEILINLSDKNHLEKRGHIGGEDGFVITEVGIIAPTNGGYTAPVESVMLWAFYDNEEAQECVAEMNTKGQYETKYDLFENQKWVKARRILLKLMNPETAENVDTKYFWIKVVPL